MFPMKFDGYLGVFPIFSQTHKTVALARAVDGAARGALLPVILGASPWLLELQKLDDQNGQRLGYLRATNPLVSSYAKMQRYS